MKAAAAAEKMTMKKEAADPQHPMGANPWFTLPPKAAPTAPPLKFPKAPLVPTGSSLKDTIKGINMRQRMEATGPTNVTMTAPINIHGVSADKAGAVAQEVKAALQDPVRQLLDQIKAARNYESRLGYV